MTCIANHANTMVLNSRVQGQIHFALKKRLVALNVAQRRPRSHMKL